ncbi:MAG TPA: TadE/TadG family type IV pilus assembly protein [Rhizobiaceae bacterium]|nr:TadE/TadG family type IV pilus assembly protein [Rhizobiaceae bacterium]
MADTRGNFAVVFGTAIPVLALGVGFAVDTAQLYSVKSNLQQALDAAVTSTTRDLTTGKIKPDDARGIFEAFFATNTDPDLIGGGVATVNSLVVNRTTRTIAADVSVDAKLLFPLFGMDATRRISVDSAAVYSDKQIEIAMMLDVTGSMAKKGKLDKIGDLKTAAENAVKTVLKNQDPKNPRVRVALVPYASGVNVGALAENLYAEKSSSSDLPPVAGSAALVTATGSKALPSYADYVSAVGGSFPRPDNCATERKTRDGKADMSDDGPDTVRTDKNGKKYYALVNRDNNLAGSGMNRCPDAKVVPLTAEQDALLASIKDFEANGYTGGAIAIQWTYYMLSSSWRSVIKSADLGDGPADPSKKIAKVAILMTDGQFNTAYAGVGSNFNGQGAKSRGYAESLCRNMKTDGIEIFTIGFDLNNKDMSPTERDQAKAVLKNCASDDESAIKHYFEVSTGEELDAAFQAIIGNAERLALTH